jgi:hypothetical protein
VKKTFTLCSLALCMFSLAQGQDYRQAVGLRLGASGGITYRRVISSNLSAELMLVSQNHGTSLVLLVEKHRPALLFDDLNLDFIYGAGVHLGAADHRYVDSYYEPNDQFSERYSIPQLGLDGYASFEYTLPRYPVILNLDCKPYIEFFDDHFLGLHLPVIALGAKYIF